MPQKIMGIALDIDVASATNGLEKFRRNVRAAKSEFKAVSSELDDWKKSSAGVEMKLDSLNKITQSQEQYIKKLREGLEAMIASGEASEEQIQNQKNKINDQVASYNKAIDEVRKYTKELAKLKASEDTGLDKLAADINLASAEFEKASDAVEDWRLDVDAMNAKAKLLDAQLNKEISTLDALRKEYESLANSSEDFSEEMTNLRANIIRQEGAVKKARRSLDDHTAAQDTLNREIRESNRGFPTLVKSLSAVKKAMNENSQATTMLSDGFTVLKGVVAHYVTHTLTSFFGTLKAMLRNARELRKELGMIQATIQNMELDKSVMKNAEANLKRIYTVTEDTAAGTEAINNLLTAGFKTESLDNITKELLGASIKWKDTLNMEGLSDSIQEAIGSKGMSVTGQFAELLERMGIDLKKWTGDFSKLNTDAERQNMIMKTLADQGLAGVLEQYEEINKTIVEENKIVYDTLNISAQFAETMNPAVLAVRRGMNELLIVLMNFVKESGGIEVFVEKIDKLFEIFKNGLQMLLDNIPIVIGLIGAWSVAITSTKISSFFGHLSDDLLRLSKEGMFANVAMSKLGTSLGGLGGAMGALKVAGIVAGIVALAAGLVWLYKNNEEFRTSVQEMWATLKPVLQSLWDTVKSLLPSLMSVVEAIGSLLTTIIPILTPIIDLLLKILVPTIKQIVGALEVALAVVRFAIDAVVLKLQQLVGFWKAIFDSIKAIFSGDTDKLGEIWTDFGNKMLDGVKNLFSGLLKGFADGFRKMFESWSDMWYNIVDWFKNLLGIHSPSTVFEGFGKNIIQGLINGIKAFFGKIKDTITSLVNFFTDLPSRVWSKIKGVGDKIKDAFGAAVDKVKGIGGDIVSGLWRGIDSKTQWIKNKITGFAEKAGQSIIDFFKINSPSKWAIEKGGFIGEGLGIGVANSIGSVKKNIGRFNESFANGITGGMSTSNNRSTVVNAGLTVHYNGNLSRKELKRLENDNYNSIKLRLRTEGGI